MDHDKIALVEKKIDGLILKISRLKQENNKLQAELKACGKNKEEVKKRIRALVNRIEELGS